MNFTLRNKIPCILDESEIMRAEGISAYVNNNKNSNSRREFIIDIKGTKFPIGKTMLNIFLYLLRHRGYRKNINDIIIDGVRDFNIEENTIVKNIERFNKSIGSVFPEYLINSKRYIGYQIGEGIYNVISVKHSNQNVLRISWNGKGFGVSINDDPIVCFELSGRSSSLFIECLKSGTKFPNRMAASHIRQVLKKVGLGEILLLKSASEGFFHLETDYSKIKNTRVTVENVLNLRNSKETA